MSTLSLSPADFARRFTEIFAGAEAPLVLSYTDDGADLPTEPARGCFFKALRQAREGKPLTLSARTITCGGGRLYTGFDQPTERIEQFVSQVEHYKQTPELVRAFVTGIGLPPAARPYIRFARVDTVDSFEDAEGLLFFATPDELSGLVGWAQYDINAPDAVSAPFGSGCSSLVAQTVAENRRDGQRCFLGLFDPSVRPAVEANVLGFSIPLSRFRVMADTLDQCFLSRGKTWIKVRERMAAGTD